MFQWLSEIKKLFADERDIHLSVDQGETHYSADGGETRLEMEDSNWG